MSKDQLNAIADTINDKNKIISDNTPKILAYNKAVVDASMKTVNKTPVDLMWDRGSGIKKK